MYVSERESARARAHALPVAISTGTCVLWQTSEASLDRDLFISFLNIARSTYTYVACIC
jgi:hypothetical protein